MRFSQKFVAPFVFLLTLLVANDVARAVEVVGKLTKLRDDVRRYRRNFEGGVIEILSKIPPIRERLEEERERLRRLRVEEDARALARRRESDLQQNPCLLRYVWGHGGDTRRVVHDFHEDTYVGMGCSIGKLGAVEGAVVQKGSNGGWYGSLDKNSNGGFNPILSRASLSYGAQEDSKFKENEAEFLRRNYTKEPKEGLEPLIRQVTSVGFMRLATQNWFALLNHAFRRLDTRCEFVQIKFICSSDSTQKYYGTSAWRQRILDAKNAYLYSEVEKKPIGFYPMVCAERPNLFSRAKVWNVPMYCDEIVEIDQSMANALRQGACRENFQKFNQ